MLSLPKQTGPSVHSRFLLLQQTAQLQNIEVIPHHCYPSAEEHRQVSHRQTVTTPWRGAECVVCCCALSRRTRCAPPVLRAVTNPPEPMTFLLLMVSDVKIKHARGYTRAHAHAQTCTVSHNSIYLHPGTFSEASIGYRYALVPGEKINTFLK